MMEYITTENLITAGVAIVMLRYLMKIFTCDIGDNRSWFVVVFLFLGCGLYLWHSGHAGEAYAFLNDRLQK